MLEANAGRCKDPVFPNKMSDRADKACSRRPAETLLPLQPCLNCCRVSSLPSGAPCIHRQVCGTSGIEKPKEQHKSVHTHTHTQRTSLGNLRHLGHPFALRMSNLRSGLAAAGYWHPDSSWPRTILAAMPSNVHNKTVLWNCTSQVPALFLLSLGSAKVAEQTLELGDGQTAGTEDSTRVRLRVVINLSRRYHRQD